MENTNSYGIINEEYEDEETLIKRKVELKF